MQDSLWYGPSPTGRATRESGTSQAAVLTKGLVRRFGSLTAVDGLDLHVRRGEIYGFLGPNGAGKSTVVRMLCTLLRPSGGSAVVAGCDLVRDPQPVRFRIGVALHKPAFDDWHTVRMHLPLHRRHNRPTPPHNPTPT